MDNFIDELLQEVEEKEQKLLASHADLLLNEIGSLQHQIDTNFTQADEEKRIIHEWALSRNSKLLSITLVMSGCKNKISNAFSSPLICVVCTQWVDKASAEKRHK